MENNLRTFWLILAFCIMIPLCFLSGKFFGYPFSESLEMWGVFGDFIGGIVGTIIAIANLYIIVRLTIFVQSQSNQQALSNQKRIIQSQLRQEAVKDISQNLNTLGQKIYQNPDKMWEILKIEQALSTFCKNYIHLFPDLDSTNLKKEMNNLKTAINTQPYNSHTISTIFGTYLEEKDIFIQRLHSQIINGLNE